LSYLRKEKRKKENKLSITKRRNQLKKEKNQQQLKKRNQYCYLTEENLLFFQKATDHAKA